jgi:uncharacterized protein YutE (UPF0331/DUF86 family)
MKYNGVIEKKIRLLDKKVNEIKSWKIKSLEQLMSSSMLNNALERALQVSVEIMIDISERILAIEKISPQNSAAENIKKLEDLSIIKKTENYMDMVRFRNFIVHRYEYIDLDILFDIAKNKLHYFNEFIDEIRNN